MFPRQRSIDNDFDLDFQIDNILEEGNLTDKTRYEYINNRQIFTIQDALYFGIFFSISLSPSFIYYLFC